MKALTVDMPMVALRGLAVLPGMSVSFDISRQKSIKAVERAMELGGTLLLVSQLEQDVAEPTIDDLFKVGCVVTIRQIAKLPQKLIRVTVEGQYKAELFDVFTSEGMLVGKSRRLNDIQVELTGNESKAMLESFKELLHACAAVDYKFNKDVAKKLLQMKKLESILDGFAVNFPMEFYERQEILECRSIIEKFEYLSDFVANETEVAIIKSEMAMKVKERVDNNQREYVLREQLKQISEELGEDDVETEADEFMNKAKELDAPSEVKEKLFKEIKRYRTMSLSSSESSVERGYIEAILEMPWNKASKDNLDVNNALRVLDKDHYGLKKPKERIVEYLSVKKLNNKGNVPIICLAGPPGTGKTSIAKSMANALGREYVRICLGGVRDEAEIRGHRKTYVGAMPGRIAEAIRKAGVKNPLILLDEIDKVSQDRFKGDTEAALLEVLDGEQNSHFRDHYLEVPIDLSEVLFIATANDLSNLSRPLLDRMEVIEVSSYTANEKFHIAKNHLVKKQLETNGIEKNQLSISDKALKLIISAYTKESGVRDLERNIGTICRKTAKMLVANETDKVKVTDKNLKEFLGKEKYRPDHIYAKDDVGVVRGLAWTSVGGDTLSIEVNTAPGKGELKLTGQLGDVMKESAMVALSYVKSIASQYGVLPEFFTKNDFHMHIPEGAIPKDGPSAGVTMATALTSVVSGKKVSHDVAMTGEITIRGRVLAIGGLKEKLLAAKMAGVKKVLVPLENEADVAEIEDEIKNGLEIKYMENMTQVLENALCK